MTDAAQWAIADMSRWSVIKVRKACHDAGLPGSGRKAHLLRRFSQHLKEQEPNRQPLGNSHQTPTQAQNKEPSANAGAGAAAAAADEGDEGDDDDVRKVDTTTGGAGTSAAAASGGRSYVEIAAGRAGGGGKSVDVSDTPQGFRAAKNNTPQKRGQKDPSEHSSSLPRKGVQDGPTASETTEDANPSTPVRPLPLSFDKLEIASSRASDGAAGPIDDEDKDASQERVEESFDEKWASSSVDNGDDDGDISDTTSQLSFLASLRNLINRAQQEQLLPQKELHRVARSLSHAKQLLLSNLKARDVDVEAMGMWMADTRARLRESVRTSMADVYPFWSVAYMSRLLAAIALFFVTGYINSVSAASAGWRTPHIQVLDLNGNVIEGQYTLPDLGLDLVSWLGTTFLPAAWIHDDGCIDWQEGPDVFVHLHMVMFVLLIVISPQRLKIVRRLFVVFAILNALRAFTVIVTSLPDASPKCALQWDDPATGAYKRRPMFPANLWRGFKVLCGHTTCGDMIFSGHATLMLLTLKTYLEYFHSNRLCYRLSNRATWWGRFVVRMLTIAGLLVVLSTKLHYTLDVAIAVYLNLRIWDVYHLYARTVSLRGPSDDILHRTLLWFEAEHVISIERRVYSVQVRHDAPDWFKEHKAQECSTPSARASDETSGEEEEEDHHHHHHRPEPSRE